MFFLVFTPSCEENEKIATLTLWNDTGCTIVSFELIGETGNMLKGKTPIASKGAGIERELKDFFFVPGSYRWRAEFHESDPQSSYESQSEVGFFPGTNNLRLPKVCKK